MKIFVTGATGLLGNNCVRQLAHEHEVHVLVRENHDQRPLDGLPVTLHFGDLTVPESLSALVPSAVDAIIHAAGDAHIGAMPRPSQRTINTVATNTLSDLALRQGIRLVFISSVDALPAANADSVVNEQTPDAVKYPIGYVQTKRQAESHIRTQIQAGLDAVIVNPGFMLGPWDWKPSSGRMLLEVATTYTPFAPSGGFSLCDVRDVAAAVVKIATTPVSHQRYILAGHNLPYFEAWQLFARISGGSPPQKIGSPSLLNAAGRWGDFVGWIRGIEGDINSGSVAMSQLFHYYDSQRAQRDLAYRPRPIEESVADAWQWFQEYGYAD